KLTINLPTDSTTDDSSTIENISVEKIEINKNELSVTTTDKIQLSATITPTNATNKNITWVSSNGSVATVDENGLVTVKTSGTVYIVAKATNDLTIKDSCKLTISLPNKDTESEITEINLTENQKKLNIKDTYEVKYDVNPTDQKSNVTFASTNTSIATVNDNGLVTAQGIGTAYIKVFSKTNEDVFAILTVIVNSNTEEKIDIDSIYLNKTNLELYENTKYTLSYNINPVYATNKEVTWSSSDKNILTVDSNGLITAVSPGVATVKIVSNDDFSKFSICEITVLKKETTNTESSSIIAYDDNIQVETQEESNILEFVQLDNVDEDKLIYESSDINVLEIDDDGTITTKDSGYVTIKVSSKEDPTVSTEINVLVNTSENMASIKNSQLYFYITLSIGAVFSIFLCISTLISYRRRA
ncbi:MAG: Ig-like domain-containing protein, partial [Bacilli bacterium]|nr:Ig-like domain-containing protein [Bacilli bacterium]